MNFNLYRGRQQRQHQQQQVVVIRDLCVGDSPSSAETIEAVAAGASGSLVEGPIRDYPQIIVLGKGDSRVEERARTCRLYGNDKGHCYC